MKVHISIPLEPGSSAESTCRTRCRTNLEKSFTSRYASYMGITTDPRFTVLPLPGRIEIDSVDGYYLTAVWAATLQRVMIELGDVDYDMTHEDASVSMHDVPLNNGDTVSFTVSGPIILWAHEHPLGYGPTAGDAFGRSILMKAGVIDIYGNPVEIGPEFVGLDEPETAGDILRRKLDAACSEAR